MKGHDYIVWRQKNLKEARKQYRVFGNVRDRQAFKTRLMLEKTLNSSIWYALSAYKTDSVLITTFSPHWIKL